MSTMQLTRREFLIGAVGVSAAMGMASLAGCANSSDPIVGTWKNDNSDADRIRFDEDGTLSYTNTNFTEFGTLTGTWYAYANNPVEVDGEKWFLYTTDSTMAPLIPESTLLFLPAEYAGKRMGWGEHSDDIGGGTYQDGRMDFAVKGGTMYGAPGFILCSHNTFDEEKIGEFLSEDSGRNDYELYKAALAYSRA